jgi:hypothetical protein
VFTVYQEIQIYSVQTDVYFTDKTSYMFWLMMITIIGLITKLQKGNVYR